MKIIKSFFLVFILFVCNNFLVAQVTVGSGHLPQSYSILEVSSDEMKGGLRLPQLTTQQRENLKLDELTDSTMIARARGLTIFNIETQCFEFWNSVEWISLCENQRKMGTVDFSGCSSITVVGVYDTDKLPSRQSLKIVIPVTVTALGNYQYTATVNNVNFIAMGTFVNFGPQEVYLYPVSVSGTVQAGVTMPATVEIGLLTDDTYITCNNVDIQFVSRSTSTLKVLNLMGGSEHWDISPAAGSSAYTATNPVGWAARWVSGNVQYLSGLTKTAREYAGTAAIEILSLDPTTGGAIALLDEMLQEVSIVWVGDANSSNSRFNSGIITVLTEWAKSGQGYVVTVADKIDEGAVPLSLGLIIEDGRSSNAFLKATNMPQVFQGSDVPYNLNNELEIEKDGSNAGYITAKGGITFLDTGSGSNPVRRLGVFSPKTNTFAFAHKFSEEVTTSSSATQGFTASDTSSRKLAYNLQCILVDIWAYMLKNAPIK